MGETNFKLDLKDSLQEGGFHGGGGAERKEGQSAGRKVILEGVSSTQETQPTLPLRESMN